MNIEQLSNTFKVRKLNPKDVDLIYALSAKNDLFYQYHPPFVTKESILKDMEALPPGIIQDKKYYIGFLEGEILVAVMDLILGYPTEGTAFIGLFMMNAEYQNQGIGSKIIKECTAYLQMSGYRKIRLGVDKGNPQSNTFWKKNGFTTVDVKEYIVMEADLI